MDLGVFAHRCDTLEAPFHRRVCATAAVLLLLSQSNQTMIKSRLSMFHPYILWSSHQLLIPEKKKKEKKKTQGKKNVVKQNNEAASLITLDPRPISNS